MQGELSQPEIIRGTPVIKCGESFAIVDENCVESKGQNFYENSETETPKVTPGAGLFIIISVILVTIILLVAMIFLNRR